MQFPRIHLNGSNSTSLKLDYLKAMHAVHDAMILMQKIDLNGRDYYPISDTAFTTACMEHKARWRALATVHGELEEIVENIQEQEAK